MADELQGWTFEGEKGGAVSKPPAPIDKPNTGDLAGWSFEGEGKLADRLSPTPAAPATPPPAPQPETRRFTGPIQPPPGAEDTGLPGVPIFGANVQKVPLFDEPQSGPPEINAKTGLPSRQAGYGAVPILDAPIRGSQRIVQGSLGLRDAFRLSAESGAYAQGDEGKPYDPKKADAMKEQARRQAAEGLGGVLSGALELYSPALVSHIAMAPVETALHLGAGVAGQQVTEKTLTAAGVPQEYAGLAGDLVLLTGVYGGVQRAKAKVDSVLGEHNAVAERLLAKERSGGQVAELTDDIFRGESYPVKIGEQKVTVEYQGASRTNGRGFWRVVDETGKPLHAGTGEDVQGWLRTQGAVPQAGEAAPESPAAERATARNPETARLVEQARPEPGGTPERTVEPKTSENEQAIRETVDEAKQRLEDIRAMQEHLTSGQDVEMGQMTMEHTTPEERRSMLADNVRAHQQIYDELWEQLGKDIGTEHAAQLKAAVEQGQHPGSQPDEPPARGTLAGPAERIPETLAQRGEPRPAPSQSATTEPGFEAPGIRMPRGPAALPTMPAANKEEKPGTGLAELGGAAQAIGENMRSMLWDKAQKGDVNEAGQPSAILQAAKMARDAGGLQDREQFDQFAEDFAQIPRNKDFQANMRGLVQRYTPEKPELAGWKFEGEPAYAVQPATGNKRPSSSGPADFPREPATPALPAAAKPTEEPKHDYSSTQSNLPEHVAEPMRQFARAIPDDKLAEDGRENEPHITVKYGLHDEDPTAVQNLLKDEPPITATLGKASLFSNDDADVLKVDIDSPDLHRLNAKIAKALPNTDTHPDYTPHATIAYLKPGEGKKYDGKEIPGVTGQKVTLPSVTFSGKNGDKVEIPLKPASNGTAKIEAGLKQPTPAGAEDFRAALPHVRADLARAKQLADELAEEDQDVPPEKNDPYSKEFQELHALGEKYGLTFRFNEADARKLGMEPDEEFDKYSRGDSEAEQKWAHDKALVQKLPKAIETWRDHIEEQIAKSEGEGSMLAAQKPRTPAEKIQAAIKQPEKEFAPTEPPHVKMQRELEARFPHGQTIEWKDAYGKKHYGTVSSVEHQSAFSGPGTFDLNVQEGRRRVVVIPHRATPIKPEDRPLTPEEKLEANRKRMAEIEAQLHKPEEKPEPTLTQKAGLSIDDIIKQATAKLPPARSPGVRTAAEIGKKRIVTKPNSGLRSSEQKIQQGTKNPLKSAADAAQQRLRDRLKARGHQLNSGFDPKELAEDLVDLTTIGASHIIDGALKFKDWAKRVMGSVGDLVRAMAKDHGKTTGGVLHEVHPMSAAVARSRGVEAEAAPPLDEIERIMEEEDASVERGGTAHPEPVGDESPAGSAESAQGAEDRAGGEVSPAKRGNRGKRSRKGSESGPGERGSRPGLDESELNRPPKSNSVSDTRFEHDYRIPDGRVVSGSPETRADRNINAIRVLRQIQAENRPATVAEQDALAGYVGWGAVPQLFAGNTPEWKAVQDQLRELLNDEEYADAQNSTVNAHYTSDAVVDAMWKALENMGAKPGMNWLEPAVGVGNYFGRMPAHLLEGARRLGVEKDSVSAQIAKLLYPDSAIDNKEYQKAELPKDYFDGIISNVPFAEGTVHDVEFRGQPHLRSGIHNYYFAKALTQVRPGGVVAFITSRYTMDGYGNVAKALRKWVAGKADFLGAVRLPTNAFMQSSGTHVITDIIFLRRRLPNAEPAGEPWVETKNRDLRGHWGQPIQIPTSEYYHAHPNHVLGEEGTNRGRFSENDYDVKGALTPEKLESALAKIRGEFQPYARTTKAPERKALSEIASKQAEDAKLGGLFFDDNGKLYRKTSKGSAEPMDLSKEAMDKVRGQLAIRDRLNELLELERKDAPDLVLDIARQKLNNVYDKYTNAHGPLSARANLVHLKGDPDRPVLVSLERRFDPKANTAQKAPIFSRRMLQAPKTLDRVDNAKDALYLSLNELGRIDFEHMAELTGKSPKEMQDELAGIIFEDPDSNEWQMADEYLTGAVRSKLRQARAMAAIEPRFESNVKALEAVQPDDIPPDDIRVALGTTWVPTETYTEFVTEILASDTPVQARYAGGEWHLDEPYYKQGRPKNQWDAEGAPASRLLQDSFNLRRTKVYSRNEKGEPVLDATRTEAAQTRQTELQDEFQKWLFTKDPKRTLEMARLYNDIKNDLRLPHYDGSHLSLPEIVRDQQIVRGGDLDPHQKNAVWRAIRQRNVLFAHWVGTGKTFEGITAGMELKRLGLIQRPMYVVPNATLGGWQLQFNQLYPQKRIIVFTENDLKPENRKATIALIATGEWDAAVIPHSSFKKIPTGDELFQQHFKELEDLLAEQIEEAEGAGIDTRQIKRMEKQRDNFLAKLEDRRNVETQDQTVTWEDLGIDWMFVDESHIFRKLGFTTKQVNLAGIDTNGNQMTFDLLMKMRHVQKHGRGVVFATGTPIVNTIGEMYSLMRYLIPQEMAARGIAKFDEWSSDYGRTIGVFEPKPEGGGYRKKDRFAKIVNVPELANLFRSFADVVTSEQAGVKTPPLAGGERKAMMTELSDDQLAYLEELKARGAAIRANPKNAMPDNMLAVYTDAGKMALDIRLIDPTLPDHPDSRLNLAADRIYRDWLDSAEMKGAQAVFCDLGVPDKAKPKAKRTGGFSVYDDLIKKLVARGIPRNQIATIYDAKDKNEAAKLFADVNDGKIRVFMGSTKKAGVGVNIQQRLYSMHHLDLPPTPADLEQREGRGLRQGNMSPDVRDYYYMTRGSLDEMKFANVTRKAKFVKAMLEGKASVREMEDAGEMIPSLEAFQAAVSADPRVMRRMEVEGEVNRLGNLRYAWNSQRYNERRDLAEIEPKVAGAEEQIRETQKDIARRDSHEKVWKVGGRGFDKLEDAGKAFEQEYDKTDTDLDANYKAQATEEFDARRDITDKDELKAEIASISGRYTRQRKKEFPPRKLADYAGFEIWFHPLNRFGGGLQIRGNQGYHLERKDTGKGTLLSAAYTIGHLENLIHEAEERIKLARKDETQLRAALAKTWPYEQKLSDLQGELAKLELELQGKADTAAVDDGEEVKDDSVEAAEAPEDDEEPEAKKPFGSERGSFSLRPKVSPGEKLRRALENEGEESSTSKEGPGLWVNPSGQSVTLHGDGGKIATHGTTAMKMTGKKTATDATSDLFGQGYIRLRSNSIEFGKSAGPRAILAAVKTAKEHAEEIGQTFIMVRGHVPQPMNAVVGFNEIGRFASNPVGFLTKQGQRGSVPATALIAPTAKVVDLFEKVKQGGDEILKLIAPAAREGAEPAAMSVRHRAAELARESARAEAALEAASKILLKLPEDERWAFYDRVERGEVEPDRKLEIIGRIMRALLDQSRKDVQDLGNGKLESFIENYLPHYYKDPEKARKMFADYFAKKPLEGSKSFLKRRKYETLADGMASGLEPISDNPVDMVLLKVREMQKYVMAHQVLKDLKKQGILKFVRASNKMPEGYSRIDDKIATVFGPPFVDIKVAGRPLSRHTGRPEGRTESGTVQPGPLPYVETTVTRRVPIAGTRIMGYYAAPEPAARLVNNYLSPGLREKSSLFRGFLALGNSMNQFQLGFSAFHLGFTSMDAATSGLALGIYQTAHGNPVTGLLNALKSPIELAGVPIGLAAKGLEKAGLRGAEKVASPFSTMLRGDSVLKEYCREGSQGGDLAAVVDAMLLAGGRARMDKFYLNETTKHMMEAFRTLRTTPGIGRKAGKLYSGTWRVPLAIAEQLSRPIMEYIVPRQKMGVFADLARYELKRLKDASPEEVQAALARAWDSVDNRMGQLVYDNLFWHKIFKDALMGSIRSVGWNTGTIRELLGGAADIRKLAAKDGTHWKPDVTTRLSYIIALPFMAAFVGAILQYLYTGEHPRDLKDCFFPRTGRLDKNGQPERVSSPSYIKDFVHYTLEPVRTAQNKIHPLLTTIWEMLENKDYRNKPIRNAEDPVVQQLEEEFGFALKAYTPMAVKGSQQEKDRGASIGAQIPPFFGISPAPSVINRQPKTSAKPLRMKVPRTKR